MQRFWSVKERRACWRGRGWGVPLQIRLGLHTGTVIVGRIGDNLWMDYTVQGDTTALAAQLQQMVPPGAVWVSEATYRMARDAFVWQAVGLMAGPARARLGLCAA